MLIPAPMAKQFCAALYGWEAAVIIAVVAILFMARVLSGVLAGRTTRNVADDFVLWIAQGFGCGRIPFAAGTLGSVVGVMWFLLLLSTGSIHVFLAGAAAAVVLSVWFCGEAEKTLGETDPGSVVFDEICAVPLCFTSWLGMEWVNHGHWPAPEYFFSDRNWPLLLAVFAAFRFFDVVKPWPIRQSQRLPGGWGVTMDDVLAALYVNVLVMLVFLASTAAGGGK